MGLVFSSPCLSGCEHRFWPPFRHREAIKWPKTVFLVRHGESTYNAYYEKHSVDPHDLWDAPLTVAGEEQAQNLQVEFKAVAPVTLVLTSPLSRALRTCLLAMPPQLHTSSRYEVNAQLAEHLEASCDNGRSPVELRAEFPELSFDGLEEVWWYVPDECRTRITPELSRQLFTERGRREPLQCFQARVDAIASMLAARADRTIAVFGHADFFHELLKRHFSVRDARFGDYWMRNCELLKLTVAGPEQLLSPLVDPTDCVNEATKEAAHQAVEPLSLPTPGVSRASRGLAALKREIASENPKLTPLEVQRSVSTRWKDMQSCTREMYMDMQS